MKTILFAASLVALAAAPAFAADESMMAGYFGNTVIAAGGMVDTHTWYNADHTFEIKAASYDFKGTWSFDDKGQLCRHYADPAPPGVPNPLCTPWAAHKVGDKWTASMGGQSRDLSVVAGQQ